MIDLQKIDLTPNEMFYRLNVEQFIELFIALWEGFCIFKGKKFDTEQAEKSIKFLWSLTRGKFRKLNVNDITSAVEYAMYNDEFKLVSVEFFMKIIQKKDLEKGQEEEIIAESKFTKEDRLKTSTLARAVNLRLIHDKKGKILDKENETIEDVHKAVLDGFNYYTGEPL